jgi:putative CocE/NonD family hydrolase
MRSLCASVAFACALASAAPLQAAPTPAGDYGASRPIERDYDVQVVMVPMRDGARLKTTIYVPRIQAAPQAILLTRTPYPDVAKGDATSKRLETALPPGDAVFSRAGFTRVYQDIRGRGGSEGEFVFYRPQRGVENATATDESTDAWDTIDWLVRHVPDTNGRVGIIGASWRGYTALTALISPHPALKAVVPVNPVVDRWRGDDDFDDGAFRMIELCFFEQTMRDRDGGSSLLPGQDLYEGLLPLGSAGEAARRLGMSDLPYWRRLTAHPAYDEFWQGRSLIDKLASQINTVPVLLVAGLFDADDRWGAFRAYETLSRGGPGAALPFLAIGPWAHAQSGRDGSRTGPLIWGEDTAATFAARQLLPFLRANLQQTGEAPPRVLAFDTGSREWRTLAEWGPAAGKAQLYFQTGATLSAGRSHIGSSTTFTADPANPVPTRARPILGKCGDPDWRNWLTDDQRVVASRPDVVSWSTADLVQDMAVSGSATLEFYASTTGSDADWVVKLIDKFPAAKSEGGLGAGYELMISTNVLRARYRDNPSLPRALRPGEVVRYHVILPPVVHTLKRGHRLIVRVQGSSFPLYDRNPQTFVDNIFEAPKEAYVAQRQTIFQSPDRPSGITLPLARPLPAHAPSPSDQSLR